MKQLAIALFCVALLGAAAAQAQPPTGYVGLFMDESHSYWCASGSPPYPVEMWVCCLPSVNGQICSEFAVSYPSNVTKSTVTVNYSIVTVTLPGPVTCYATRCDVIACYISCQLGWHWIFHQTLWVMDGNPSCCEIIPHPMVGAYHFANCLPGYPVEPCIRWTSLYVNYAPTAPECLGSGFEPSSWGSIKALLE
jgi:hypothetical protein